jgi:hypothetical protein
MYVCVYMCIYIYILYIYIYIYKEIEIENRDIAVCVAADYGLDDRGVGVRVVMVSRIITSPHRPDRLWGPPSLLSNEYRRLFPRG